MPELADADLLRVWETMRGQTLPRRAAALLALGSPGAASQEVLGLGLAESERRLLRLRTQSFGTHLACVADCAACGQAFEFDLDARALERGLPPRDAAEPLLCQQRDDGCRIEWREPTLGDCIAAADAPDAARACQRLIERCARGSAPDGSPLAADALPPDLLQSAETELDAAQCLLALDCPSCGHAMSAPLDIAAYCWAEIEARVPRLLAEVHLLASRYGWHESDILAMSRVRRERYLGMVMS